MDHLDAGEVSKEDVLTFLHGCQQCNYVASKQDSLNLHYHLIHSKSSSVSTEDENHQTFSNFKCALCNFRARYEDDVKIHFETQHNYQVTVDATDGTETDVKNYLKVIATIKQLWMKSMKLNLMRYVMKNSFRYKFVCVQSSLVAEFMFSLTNIASVTPDTRLTDQPSLYFCRRGSRRRRREAARNVVTFLRIFVTSPPHYAPRAQGLQGSSLLR